MSKVDTSFLATGDQDRGQQLFDCVSTYAAFGDHRSGTDVDRATAEWVAESLVGLGLDAEIADVPFDRYHCDSELTVDGLPVEHLPIYYAWSGEGSGSIATTDVVVRSIDPMVGGFAAAVDGPIAEAQAVGAEAAVLSTQHPEGSLVATNRDPESAQPGFPAVLVAGRDFQRLSKGQVSLMMTAREVPGRTSNVVARNGVSGRPLVLTTPLNGWFGCAGERGCGVAILLDLVERFADRPLLVVATGGHELGYFGAHRFIDATDETPVAIVHVGASLAVEDVAPDGSRSLAAARLAMTSLGSGDTSRMSDALSGAGYDLVVDTEHWLGEGEAWSRMAVPMLSFTGAGVDFHTPNDTPQRATSPTALALVADSIAAAVEILHDHATAP